jgi:hypothetical protein
MSFNVIHYKSDPGYKQPDWKDISVKRLRADEIIISSTPLPYTAESGPTLTAYDDANNIIVTAQPITTYYQRLGQVINIFVSSFAIAAFPLGSTTYIRLEGLDFPPAHDVSGVYACSGNSDITLAPGSPQVETIYVSGFQVGNDSIRIRPVDPAREWILNFTCDPCVLTHFY